MPTLRAAATNIWRTVTEVIEDGGDDLVVAIYLLDEPKKAAGVLVHSGLPPSAPTFDIALESYPCLGGQIDLTPCARCPIAAGPAAGCHHSELASTGDHRAFLVFFWSQTKDGSAATLRALGRLSANIMRGAIELERRYVSRVTELSSLVGELLADLQHSGAGSAAAALDRLSPREREVLDAFARLGRIAGVAKQLCISPHTVRKHVKAIYRKLGVHSQAELLAYLRTLSMSKRNDEDGAPLASPHRGMARVASDR